MENRSEYESLGQQMAELMAAGIEEARRAEPHCICGRRVCICPCPGCLQERLDPRGPVQQHLDVAFAVIGGSGTPLDYCERCEETTGGELVHDWQGDLYQQSVVGELKLSLRCVRCGLLTLPRTPQKDFRGIVDAARAAGVFTGGITNLNGMSAVKRAMIAIIALPVAAFAAGVFGALALAFSAIFFGGVSQDAVDEPMRVGFFLGAGLLLLLVALIFVEERR